MKRLNVSLFHKLILANVFYALPVIALVYLMVDAKNTNIVFGQWEAKGNQYQRPLEDLLQQISQVRINSLKNGKVDPQDFAKVDEVIKRLQTVQAEIGEDLQFTDEGLAKRNRSPLKPVAFIERWGAYKEKALQKPVAEAVDDLAPFVADVRGMITHAGDTSNLILDPDLDSYYLMDVTLLALPQLQDRLQDLVHSFGGVIDKGAPLTPKNRIDLAVYAALFKQSDIDRITGDVGTVIQEDPNFYGESPTLKTKLDPSVKSLAAKMDQVLQMLDSLSGNSTSTYSRDDFYATVQAATDQSYISWKTGVDELDVLLNRRLDALTADKTHSLAYAMLALLVAFSILFWVALNFNTNMKKILGSLKATLSQTNEASRELVHLSNELSLSTSDQASALQETASALDEINSMVQSTVANTESATTTAERTLKTAERSGTAMSSMMDAMKGISSSNEQVLGLMGENSQKMGQITQIISSIGDKTKVINEIVFQTKLLSFNASVEAARAGEHGKGFAVVAEEVGSLANMSGNAAQEISSLLDGSVRTVNQISEETRGQVERVLRTGKDRVSAGEDIANECHDSLQTIVQEFREVKENVDTILRAAEEQAKGIQEITKAISRIDDLTNENATMSKKTAQQSTVLSSQAEQLGAIVSTIEAEVLGRSSVKSEPSPSPEAGADEEAPLKSAA